MAIGVDTHDEARVRHLVTGAKAKGEYRCVDCGYGVTVYRELPSCPMCGSDRWKPYPWSPFTRGAPPGY